MFNFAKRILASTQEIDAVTYKQFLEWDEKEKQQYLKDHPNSKFGKQHEQGLTETKPYSQIRRERNQALHEKQTQQEPAKKESPATPAPSSKKAAPPPKVANPPARTQEPSLLRDANELIELTKKAGKPPAGWEEYESLKQSARDADYRARDDHWKPRIAEFLKKNPDVQEYRRKQEHINWLREHLYLTGLNKLRSEPNAQKRARMQDALDKFHGAYHYYGRGPEEQEQATKNLLKMLG